MGYIYGCDGRNKNCQQGVIWDRVNWFTSSIGFCDCCHKRLWETYQQKNMDGCMMLAKAETKKRLKKYWN